MAIPVFEEGSIDMGRGLSLVFGILLLLVGIPSLVLSVQWLHPRILYVPISMVFGGSVLLYWGVK